MEWTTACPDWERRIIAGESLIPCAPLFPEQAEEGLRYFKELRAVDVGDGTLTLGQISRAWILDLVAVIFGACDPETGRRLIREVFLLISKKNGKSTDAAGIMLTALLLNWRNSGEMGILAPTIEVANNAWRPARDAIRADEELSDLLQVQDHIRTITHRQTKATLQVVAADSDTVAGKKWSVTLVDELWLFGKKPNADKMLMEATGGMASRPEGFVMYSSTQSDDPPAGVFREKLAYARDVRDGKVHDPAFLPILYEFPQRMVDSGEARDPKNFYVTNPNLGASVDEEFLTRGLAQAKNDGEAKLRIFLAKHLNVQIGLSLLANRWTGADVWEQCGGQPFGLDELIERSEVAVVGIDGGGLDDLLGLTVIGREKETRKWLWWSKAWCHPKVLELRKEIAPRLRDFEKSGDLSIVETGKDVQELADIVCRLNEAKLLPDKHAIGVDPAGIGAVIDELTQKERGIEEEQIIAISQGWKLQSAIKNTERQLSANVIVHGKQDLMAWCVGNARIEDKGNAILVTKAESGKAKIDPLMAGFSATSLMSLNPQGRKKKFQFFAVG